ncbi:hypothetical protein QCA50_004758 [Cerrena zonata]|uniref:TEA domain-containing protein n=1 Tax=Cerrena zonata TaxID=2478898 RepID=A0AAW0GQ56_9APHY
MSSRQPAFAQHVRVSSTEDVSYTLPSTGSAGTSDVIQTIVTGRKCWKTIKGKGEVVWPPYLEAALIEGLEKYRPVETRSTRALGRYPMRNKFISEYIFNATGKRRTPKQVGSRLQQLRDTCEGKRILKLLSSRSTEAAKTEQENKDTPLTSSPSETPAPAPPCEQVTIDVLPSNVAWTSTDIGAIPSPGSSGPSSSSTGTSSHIPRPLRAINPTVTFKAGSPLSAQSSFRVMKDSSVVHTETTDLDLCSSSCMPAAEFPSEMECTFLYSTTLVPRYWSQLCECLDLSPYRIIQDIVPLPSQKDSEAGSASPAPQKVMLSIVYNFNVHTGVATPPRSPLTPSSICGGIEADRVSFSTESTPELPGGDYDDMFHSMQHQQTHFIPPPIQTPSYVASSYDMPPDLIRDGEEGYASLPQSPLDFAFPPSITSGVMHTDPAAGLPQTICRSYVDENQMLSAPSCYNDGMHGVGINVGASMLSGMSYQTFYS